MMSSAKRTQVITEHYEHAVRDLVAAHAKLARSPLALAVRFSFDDPLDVHLLEVVENFPGSDDDPLFATEFAPNERFLILGKLHLTLASPAQLRHAADMARARRSPGETPAQAASRATIKSIAKDGRVLHQAHSPKTLAAIARAAKTALGL